MKLQIEADVRQLDEQQLINLIKAHAEYGNIALNHRPTMRETLSLWWHRHQERKKLAREMIFFTDAVFQDFGMTRTEAEAYVKRPFWQA